MGSEAIILEGEHVRLEPMTIGHLPGLIAAGMDSSIWQWTNNIVRDESDIERYVTSALESRTKGDAYPFVTIERSGSAIVGSTRFGNIDMPNRKVEIGWTWITPAWQRTAINTEAKLLMFTHAFEVWGCTRVELKTDSNNERSRKAMLRLGCREEGTLRNHMITESGRFRDSVYFSIIESEWPERKAEIEAKLQAYK